MTEAPKPLLLLVDDTPSNLHVLAAILKADYRLKLATAGAEAIALCQREDQPQLIVLDVMMPGLSGIEVLQQLRADPATNSIPAIFLSADDSERSQLDGLDLGADDYLTKPVNATLLRARVRNILRRRQAEEQVRELNATLEQRVAERSAELEATTAALQQSLEDLSRSEARAALSIMIASITHELGTPLGNSVMTAETLAEQLQEFQALVNSGQLKRSDLDKTCSALHEGIGLVQRNLLRANELLLSFKQVAADQASEQLRHFDLALVIEDVLTSLRPSLKRHPHRVLMQVAPGIQMHSLPGPLGQVCINLINNAWLHAFEGRRDGVLTISAENMGEFVRLSFADNGVGISAEHLQRMFQPFFSTKIGQGGTGLGMTIIENLVTRTLGGQISVSSTPGEGSCFTLDIPRELPGRADAPADT